MSTPELQIRVEEHPRLELAAFVTHFPRALGDCAAPETWEAWRADGGARPLERSEEMRKDVRDLLRFGGYKPTGRGKPSSEYLVRAASEGGLRSINAAVDACNIVSLASGLPISVVDLQRCSGALRVAVAPPESSYVFNPSGQEIDVSKLLCLFDGDGPCANAVKDAQRTKTSEETRSTLSLLWCPREHTAERAAAQAWYREMLESLGAQTDAVTLA